MNVFQVIFGPVTQVFGTVVHKDGPGKIIAMIVLLVGFLLSASTILTVLAATVTALYALFEVMFMITLSLFGLAAVGGVSAYAWRTYKMEMVDWDWNTVMHPGLVMNQRPPRGRRTRQRELPPATIYAVSTRGDAELTKVPQLKKGRA